MSRPATVKMVTIPDTSWMDGGECRELLTDFFFSDDPVMLDAAKEVCRSCPVRIECVSFAIETRPEGGVWGGFDFTPRKANRGGHKIAGHSTGRGLSLAREWLATILASQ